MLEALMNSNKLNVNCSVACLIKDNEGFLDNFNGVNLNCGTYLASDSVNAKMLSLGANINTDRTIITGDDEEFVQISGGTLENGEDFAGIFVIAEGNIILRGDGVHAFEKAAGAVVSGTVYYPASCPQDLLSRVQGEKRPYPDDAFVLLGGRELKRLVAEVPANAKKVWLAGEVSAFDGKMLAAAEERGLHIVCDSLFTTESLYGRYTPLFETADPILVPDGYTVTGPLTLNEATSVLYGDKIYVRGPFIMEEKDAGCLSGFQSILVKGTASLPVSCAKAFKAVGTADSYQLFEGRLCSINGWQIFSHSRLKTMVERGERITLQINGFAVFPEDVTAQDMDAIASLSCNGFLILPGEAQGAVAQRTAQMNGFTVDIDTVKQMTGLSVQELMAKLSGIDPTDGNFNTDIFMLK